MANNVFQVKRTSTAGRTPNTTSSANSQYINAGELALNMTDKILYTSDGTNLILIGSNTVNHNITGNLTLSTTSGISANGSYGTVNQTLLSNGSAVYWGIGTGINAATKQQYTGDGTTNTFTVSGGYTSNNLSVYLNGVLLRNGVEANVNSGSTFSITPTPVSGALIDVIGISNQYTNGTSTFTSQQFTANGTANAYTISGGYVPNAIQVYVNGVKQNPAVDVVISSGTTINFPNPVPNTYIVDVFGYQSAITASSYANSIYLQSNTINITGNNITTSSLSAVNADVFSTTAYRSATYFIQVTDNTNNNYHIQNVNLVHNGSTVWMSEYGAVYSNGSSLATFDATITSGNLAFQVTPVTANSTIRISRTSLTV